MSTKGTALVTWGTIGGPIADCLHLPVNAAVKLARGLTHTMGMTVEIYSVDWRVNRRTPRRALESPNGKFLSIEYVPAGAQVADFRIVN